MLAVLTIISELKQKALNMKNKWYLKLAVDVTLLGTLAWE